MRRKMAARAAVMLVFVFLMSSCESRANPFAGATGVAGVIGVTDVSNYNSSRNKAIEIPPIGIEMSPAPPHAALAYIMAQFPAGHTGDDGDGVWLTQSSLDRLARLYDGGHQDSETAPGDHWDEERHRGLDLPPGAGYGDVGPGYGDVGPGYGDAKGGYNNAISRYGDVKSEYNYIKPINGGIKSTKNVMDSVPQHTVTVLPIDGRYLDDDRDVTHIPAPPLGSGGSYRLDPITRDLCYRGISAPDRITKGSESESSDSESGDNDSGNSESGDSRSGDSGRQSSVERNATHDVLVEPHDVTAMEASDDRSDDLLVQYLLELLAAASEADGMTHSTESDQRDSFVAPPGRDRTGPGVLLQLDSLEGSHVHGPVGVEDWTDPDKIHHERTSVRSEDWTEPDSIHRERNIARPVDWTDPDKIRRKQTIARSKDWIDPHSIHREQNIATPEDWTDTDSIYRDRTIVRSGDWTDPDKIHRERNIERSEDWTDPDKIHREQTIARSKDWIDPDSIHCEQKIARSEDRTDPDSIHRERNIARYRPDNYYRLLIFFNK